MDTEDQKVFLNLIAETRERSKLICEEAAVVQERARERLCGYVCLSGKSGQTPVRLSPVETFGVLQYREYCHVKSR